MSRPEHVAPADIFYDATEAKKYAASSRMIQIQTAMANRAIELLRLPPGKMAHILDIGCGSGLSGEALSAAGHSWVGCDISSDMLGVAVSREVEGDLVGSDMGQGLNFRAGTFDGAISISAVQWYACLASGSRAILQFYPETPQQMTLITQAAMRAGFSGGLVVDYPNSTKAKKYFLCLFAGEPSQEQREAYRAAAEAHRAGRSSSSSSSSSKAMVVEGDDDTVDAPPSTVLYTEESGSKVKKKMSKRRTGVKDREWVRKKKDRYRKQGKQVKSDSRYSGRRRKQGF